MIVQVNPAGDIEIRSGKARLARGSEYLRLNLLARHRFFRGEWFRDLRQGFPWREVVFVAHPDLEVIRAAYRSMLVTTPGVLAVRRLALIPDYQARTIGFDFHVVGTEAEVIVDTADDDFIIEFSA